MSKIPPIDQMLALLRAQPVLAKAAPQQLHTAQRRDEHVGDSSGNESSAADHVVRQVREIGRDDPQRRRRAFRSFLEGRLIDMMGRGVLNQPSFVALLDQVEQTMASDSGMASAMDAVGDQLLASANDASASGRLADAFRHGASPPDAPRPGIAGGE